MGCNDDYCSIDFGDPARDITVLYIYTFEDGDDIVLHGMALPGKDIKALETVHGACVTKRIQKV